MYVNIFSFCIEMMPEHDFTRDSPGDLYLVYLAGGCSCLIFFFFVNNLKFENFVNKSNLQ